MRTVNRIELFAKTEVKKVLKELRNMARRVLPEGDFAEREAVMLALFDEAGRGLLEEELQGLADAFDDRVLVDGVEHKPHLPGTVKYHCLSGVLQVHRYTYRPVNVRNGPTVVPLELVAGLTEGATPALAYNVAHGYGQRDMRAHGEALLMAHRTPPPRATLERMAKRLAEEVVVASPRIEPLVRRTELLPEGAHAIVLGLDRTSVPMAEERAAEASPNPERKRRKPRVRKPPKPIDVNFRMAYVGTCSVVDEDGKALLTRRYAIPAADDPAALVDRMVEDVCRAKARAPGLNVGVVQDGAPEMWNLMRDGLTKLKEANVIDDWEEGIDCYHLLERLAEALEITESSPIDRSVLLHQWKDMLDTKDGAIDSIDQYFTHRYNGLSAAKQKRLWEHLVYITNNKDRMRYVSLAVSGLPVGSGVTESSAKTVVGRRAKNSGQRWSESGLRGALTLRAIHQSDRLPAFWSRFSQRYVANVEAA